MQTRSLALASVLTTPGAVIGALCIMGRVVLALVTLEGCPECVTVASKGSVLNVNEKAAVFFVWARSDNQPTAEHFCVRWK